MGDGDIIRHRTENCGKFKRKMRNGGGHALTGQHRTGGESEGAGEGRKRGGGGGRWADSDLGTGGHEPSNVQ